MADNIQIPIVVLSKDALNEIKKFATSTETTLKKVSTSTEGTNKAFLGIQSSLKEIGTIAKVAGGLLLTAFAGRALINGLEDATEEAIRFENALIGVRSVAANFGISAKDITETVNQLASDGLVPVQDVANSLKNLLATGLGLEQATKLFLTLKDAAAFGRQGFLDLGQAIEGATQGIKNGQSTLVDNAGITKNLSVLQKEYAASIGTTIGKLTEAQKLEAIYQGILREGQIFVGDAAKLQLTYSGAVAKLNFSFTKLQVTIGQFITRSPVISRIVSTIADAFNNFTETINQNSGVIADSIKDTILFFTSGAIQIIDTVDFLSRSFIAFGKTIADFFNDLIFITLKDINTVIGFINKLSSFLNIDPIKDFTQELNELIRAGNIASKDIEETFTKDTVLSLFSDNLKQVNAALKQIKPTADLDELNKQIKKVSDTTKESSKDFNKVSKDSIEFVERFSAELSKLEEKISKSFGATGQSIRSAISFAFGGEKSDLEKQLDERERIIEKAFDDEDIGEVEFELEKKKIKEARKELTKNSTLAIGTGLLNAFSQGSKGANDAVIGLTQLLTDKLIPGVGTALGPLFELFAQGPEATKQALNEFARALPLVIENILLSIPAAIEVIANNADVIIERIVDRADEIIIALVKAAPRVSVALAKAVAFEVPKELILATPQIAFELAKQIGIKAPSAIFDGLRKALRNIGPVLESVGRVIVIGFKRALEGLFGFITNIGKSIFEGFKSSIGNFFYDLGKSIFDGFVDALRSAGDIFGSVGGDIGSSVGGSIIGGIVGGPVGSIAGAIGFADGGIVPRGFNNDTFPARLTSGELVVDRSTARELQEFLASQSGVSAGTSNGLMGEIINLLRRDQQINATVQFNEDTLANIILNLSRSNARLA